MFVPQIPKVNIKVFHAVEVRLTTPQACKKSSLTQESEIISPGYRLCLSSMSPPDSFHMVHNYFKRSLSRTRNWRWSSGSAYKAQKMSLRLVIECIFSFFKVASCIVTRTGLL